MAQIKIYGTLVNDTGEPIALADQIQYAPEGSEPKYLDEVLDTLMSGGGVEELTAKEVNDLIAEASGASA